MKLKSIRITVILLLAITASIIFYSCKKDGTSILHTGSSSNVAYAVVPNGSEPIYVERQLQWIARSLPILARKVSSFKSTVHNSISSSVNKQKYNSDLQTILTSIGTTASPFNYNNAVDVTVDTAFIPNNYDSAYFFGFEFEDCMHKTMIRFLQNETSTTYSTKKLVTVAFYEGLADTVTGYFYDSLTNRVDSLLLHEDNAEDYYVWVVDADNMCLDGDPASTFAFIPEGHCGDLKCQPWYDETPANCSDCNGAQVSGTYTLKLQLLQHKYDRKLLDNNHAPDPEDAQERGYQESYLDGRYEIYYAYGVLKIADLVNNIPPQLKNAWYIQNVTKRAFLRDWYEDNEGYDTRKWTSLMLRRLKVGPGEVVREKEKSNGTIVHSSSTIPPVININKTLCFNFVPNTDRIYTEMLEWDRATSARSNDKFKYSDGIFTWEKSLWYRQNDHFTGSGISQRECPYFLGYVPETFGFTPTSTGKWLSGASLGYGTGSLYLDISSNTNVNVVKFEDTPLSINNNIDLKTAEMMIRYVLYPNP